MQTFIPTLDFASSAKVLDRQRLGKQRIECKQIIKALTEENYGWKNHPATKMWANHQQALLQYSIAVCKEWRSRGYVDNQLPWFEERLDGSPCTLPSWWGDPLVHSSHRANLIRKDPAHYGQLGWDEEPVEGYVWPV